MITTYNEITHHRENCRIWSGSGNPTLRTECAPRWNDAALRQAKPAKDVPKVDDAFMRSFLGAERYADQMWCEGRVL